MAEDPRNARLAKISADVPHSARVWNYWMGGKDNYPVDREAGDAWVVDNPGIIELARHQRQYLIRVVSYLAGEAGIRQFLDIGTGLPTMQNTHEVAQSIAPESKIVYVDNDPLVLAHARALLVNTTPQGVTTYVDADLHDPELILSDARNVLNFELPIAVMFMGVLGHTADTQEVYSIVRRIMAPLASGSYLAWCDQSNEDPRAVKASEEYGDSGAEKYHLRSVAEFRGIFEGLELVEPGLVPLTTWRAETPQVGVIPNSDAYGAVGRKP